MKTAIGVILICAGMLSAVVIDRIRAIVNDSVITQSEIYAIEKLNLNLSGLPAGENVLQARIDHHLVLQEFARQPPLQVDDEEIINAANTYRQKFADEDQFIEFLASIGMNYQDFQSELRQQILIRRFLSERFRPFASITIEEAERYYRDVFVPRLKEEGKEVPSLPESFEQIQELLSQEDVKKRISDWLQELRSNAQIAIKD